MTFLSQVINLNFSTRLQASGAHVVSDHSLIFYQGRRRRSRRSDDDGGAREVAGGCAASQPAPQEANEGGAGRRGAVPRPVRHADIATRPTAATGTIHGPARACLDSAMHGRFPSLQYSPPSLKHALQMQTAIQRGAFITVIGLGLCTDLSYVLLSTKTATCFHSTF